MEGLNHRYNHEQNINQEALSQGEPFVEEGTETVSKKFHIEKITCGQRDNPLWWQYRQYRITSIARKVLHSTNVGRPALIAKVMGLGHAQNQENIPPAMHYGIQNKAKARQRYSNLQYCAKVIGTS